MKINAEKLYLMSSAALTVVLATTPVAAKKTTATSDTYNNFNTTSQNVNGLRNNATYSASGKMDKKTAVMLVNLLRNPHLQVRAEINGQPLQTISPTDFVNNPMDLLANYTISGKTDRKTVQKLKELLQSGRKIEIQAEAVFSKKSQRVAQAPSNQIQNNFMPAYTPFYSNVTPPTYVQGNTVWVPVLINQPMAYAPPTLKKSKPEMLAGK